LARQFEFEDKRKGKKMTNTDLLETMLQKRTANWLMPCVTQKPDGKT
jgi:hypothetical protein